MLSSSTCTGFTGSLNSPPRIAEPAKIAEHLQRDAKSLDLRCRAKCRCELLYRVLGAHDLAKDGAILLPKGDGNPLLPVALFIEENVRKEDSHLAHVNLVNHRIKSEVDGLHRIDGIGENALPIWRHVNARVLYRRLDDGKGWKRTARIVFRADALDLYLVPVLVEANRLDRIGGESVGWESLRHSVIFSVRR